MPATATAQNRKARGVRIYSDFIEDHLLVIPPRTGLGMATSAAANLEKTPMIMRKKLTNVRSIA
jgi:hypothetical protein